jgi:hypothetical protein
MSLRRIAPGHHGLTIYVSMKDGLLHSREPQLRSAKTKHSAAKSTKLLRSARPVECHIEGDGKECTEENRGRSTEN